MSDSRAYEEVTVSDQGITVTKQFEEDEFPVPAIAFEFSSERDEAVLVRLEDSVPENVAVEDLGFHPEYGSEYWSVEEDTISFQRQIEPNAEYTTVYGIRATGTDDVEQFLTRPELTEIDPPQSGDAELDEESDEDIVPNVVSGETESAAEVGESGEDEPDDEDVETLELKDPNEPGESSVEDVSPDTGGSQDTPASQSEEPSTEPEPIEVDTEGLVAALAEEIRQNEVASEDVEVLREALDVADESGGSLEARVERVQQDIADLRAYTDALEEFLDDNGTAEQVLDEFRDDISTLESTVEQMEDTVADNDEQLSAVSDDVDSLGEDVQSVETTVADLEESIDGIQASMEELEDQVSDEDVIERVQDIESDISELKEWQDRIQETFGG